MLLPLFLLTLVGADEWSYSNPADWGGLCSTGKAQSPINIETTTVEHISMPPLSFNDYDVRGSVSDLNNGHTEMVQGFTSWTKQPSISGGGLGARFVLNQFHFHWDTKSTNGSEHTIDSKATPLELHFVHIREDLNETTAGTVPGGMAVTNSWYSPMSLLSPDTSSYFRYTGSLTTPPCTEGVIWSVLEEPNYVTAHQLNTMRTYFSSGEHLIIENHRPVQPLNGRKVYHVNQKRGIAGGFLEGFLHVIGF